MSRFSKNRCKRAYRRTFGKLDRHFRGTPDFCVATIDFGTTHCSVQYSVYPSAEKVPDPIAVKLDDKRNQRVPNTILFNQYGIVNAIGHQARDEYAKLKGDDKAKYAYFEHVKRNFQHEKDISRNTTVEADNGDKFFLLDVIAHILKFLKTKLIDSWEGTRFADKKASDIDWVITVPAIWQASGKQMMREAAYKAGLCSNDNLCMKLEKASGTNHLIQEKFPDRLSLALEPESAAIQCREETKGMIQPKFYMVVDIGGGTVDITSHGMHDGHTEELHAPKGNFCGGVTVNDEFQHFLEELLNDRDLKSYIGAGVPPQKLVKHKAELGKLLHTLFEAEKQSFGTFRKKEFYTIEIPYSFWLTYENVITTMVSSQNPDVQFDDEDLQLRISYTQMATFFQPAIDGIMNVLEHLLREEAAVVNTIYWVGGFGSCAYVRDKLETAIKYKISDKYTFFAPIEADMAVVRGATMFRCNPNVVHKRKVDATYGIECKIPFVESVHNPELRKRMDDKKDWCDKIFCTFVEREDSVGTNEAFVTELVTLLKDQRTMTIAIFSSERKDISYIDEPKVKRLGEVTVKLEGEGLKRVVEVVFDITHTEIQVRAYQKGTHKEFKTVVDFLSAHK